MAIKHTIKIKNKDRYGQRGLSPEQGVHHLTEATVGFGDFAAAVDADEAAGDFVVVEHGAGLVLVFL